MATLRKDGRWVARRVTNGRRWVGYGRTADEAEADLEQKIASSTDASPQSTVREFAEQIWIPGLSRLSPASRHRYLGIWRAQIAPWFGLMTLEEIKPSHIQRWADALAAGEPPRGRKPLAPRTIVIAHAVLGQIMELAVRDDLLAKNPSRHTVMPKQRPKRRRVLGPDEASKLLEAVEGSPLSAPVFLALVLGLRRGESLGLHWDDLDRQRGELQIRRQRSHRPGSKIDVEERELKTDASARTLRLTPRLVEEIDRRGNLDSRWICTDEQGSPWVPDYVTKAWRTSRAGYGLPDWSYHDLRHGAAGLIYALTRDIKIVQSVLGHAQPDMSWLYTDVQDDATAPAIAALGQRLFG